MSDAYTVIVEQIDTSLPLPKQQTAMSAGFDLYASLKNRIISGYGGDGMKVSFPAAPNGRIHFEPGDRLIVPTGIKTTLPPGMQMEIRPRSSIALKLGLIVVNAPGTVDADYNEEIGVLLGNISGHPVVLSHGERIAQAVFMPYLTPTWKEGLVVKTTDRDGGWGSTGTRL